MLKIIYNNNEEFCRIGDSQAYKYQWPLSLIKTYTLQALDLFQVPIFFYFCPEFSLSRYASQFVPAIEIFIYRPIWCLLVSYREFEVEFSDVFVLLLCASRSILTNCCRLYAARLLGVDHVGLHCTSSVTKASA